MPRKSPTKQIDILGKPDSNPVHDVRKYLESKIPNKICEHIKEPVWDSVGDSLENFYVNARLEHENMLLQKESLIEHQKSQNLLNKNRTKLLLHAQASLRQRFVRASGLFREFQEKRNAALKNGLTERKIQKELYTNSNKIRKDINELAQFLKIIKATSNEYEPYEIVLEKVVEEFKEFKSVKELMDRCDALMLAQVEISEMSERNVDELEYMRKRLITVANEAALQILGLKNELSSVDRLYEAARNACLKWEKTLSEARTVAREQEFKTNLALKGIHHMYVLLCNRRLMLPKIPFRAVEKRLEFIRNEVEVLQEILIERGGNDSEHDQAAVHC